MTWNQEQALKARVMAEINVADVMQFAREIGMPITLDEAAELLADAAQSKGLMQHMMDAGRDYLAATLEARRHRAWWETACGHETAAQERYDA